MRHLPMNRRAFVGGTAAATLALGCQIPGALPATAAGDAKPSDVSEELVLTVAGREIRPRLVSPPASQLAKDPWLLLNLCGDRELALTTEPYCLGVRLFLSRGHRALSFDLPDHGSRVERHGEGIQGWRNAWMAGEDRFQQFVKEASAVIDKAIEIGRAKAGKIAVYGISRGGYLAMRLLAAEARIAAAAAIAPVTDWRVLREFAKEKDIEDLANQRLARWAESLATKRIFIAMGDSDERVGTLSCCRFFLELQEANARRSQAALPVEFHCARMAEPGHTVDDSWRRRGAEFLLE